MPRSLIIGPLIMGASGRLGRALARVWPDEAPAPLWQTRNGAGGTLAWDILKDSPPDLPAINGIVVLAGVTQGSAEDLAANTTLARAGVDLGHHLKVPVLVASTQAVYGLGGGLLKEDAPLAPISAYGRAKRAMEDAITSPHVTSLRLGNIAGCDGLAAAIARGRVTLDRFSDGQGPRRAMLGANDLAYVLIKLLAAPHRPSVLNVARPGLIAMADLLTAAGLSFDWRPAGPEALPSLELDVSMLQGICPLPRADAIAMAVQGGWA
jgi:dTDP-4-dehydrorhamnose reductase